MDEIFSTETIHDLPLHKEYCRSCTQASLLRTIFQIILGIIIVWYIASFDNPRMVYAYLFVFAVYIITMLIRNRRDGDVQYRRMLQASGGRPQHLSIRICDDGIHRTDNFNGNKYDSGYDIFRSIIDTPNLLIMVTNLRSCIVLEKRWMKGGSADTVAQWLLQKCPNIKRKKLRKVTFGKWVSYIVFAIMVIGLLLALLNLPQINLWDRLSGRLHNQMSYQEMATELASLDIVISDQTIRELEEYDAEYAVENGDYYTVNYDSSKVFDLLCREGTGFYDEKTYEWTPSQSGVYWFDAEFWNVGSMYTEFLTGLSHMHDELNITNITEDHSNVDYENGTGEISFSFDLNGQHYELTAQCYYDWFDTYVLYEVGRILAEDEYNRNLYFTEDGGQGFLLYYGSSTNRMLLEKKTGVDFDAAVPSILNY